MAQPFGNPTGPQQPAADTGPMLSEINTDKLGSLATGKDQTLQLLPNPWRADSLPRPTSSLLAVASTRGILVAAGPTELVVASTSKVRSACLADGSEEKDGDKFKAFQADVTIPVPRLSHIAFTADDGVLVIAGEEGMIVAYTSDSLKDSNAKPALQIPTDGQALAAVVPNPNPKTPGLVALVTTSGKLLLADLNVGQLKEMAQGMMQQPDFTCVSWSTMGRQLVAGRRNCTAVQMSPDGAITSLIPQPPGLDATTKHMSTISWVANDTFFVVYSHSAIEELAESSDFYIISRVKDTQNYTFQTLPEACSPYGMNRSPAGQFVGRLRKWKPAIEDMIIVASTTSTDIGLVTTTTEPLSAEDPVINSYTLTLPLDDSRRAQMPMSRTEGESSPIGLAIDLSSTDTVVNPIPDTDQTPGPVPNLMILNHEGVLLSWWIIYADSIRQETQYPGLTNVEHREVSAQAVAASPAPASAPIASPARNMATGFGAAAFGQPSAPSPPAFAKPATSGFGAPAEPKFGAPSAFGAAKTSWASTGFGAAAASPTSSGFGQPAFASSPLGGASALGGQPAFGAAGGFGARAAFGQPALTANPSPFGGQLPSGSAFGSKPGEASKGFAGFSGSGGFAAANTAQKASPFADTAKTGSGFGSAKPFSGGTFGTAQPASGFGTAQPAPSVFGADNFSIKSSFKRDETSAKDADGDDGGAFSFKGGLGAGFGTANKDVPVQSVERDMETPPAEPPRQATPPPVLPEPRHTPAAPIPSLFGQPHASEGLPAWNSQSSTTPKETPKVKTKPLPLPATPQDNPDIPKIKTENPSDDSPVLRAAEPPLPPDSTSKPRYISSSEQSKLSDDTPVPEDFAQKDSHLVQNTPSPSLPEEEVLSSDYEGGVEDETQEIDPVPEEQSDQIQTSPESSFGKVDSQETSPAGGVFTKVSTKAPANRSALFGEVTGPILPPPVPQESPRSPSPIRQNRKDNLLSLDSGRSFSAPAHGRSSSAIGRKRAELIQSNLGREAVFAPETPRREEPPQAETSLDLDEDDEFLAELQGPLEPSEDLEPFIAHQLQHENIKQSAKGGLGRQIEMLFKDIKCMIDIFGLNARALSNHLLHQSQESSYGAWPAILSTDTPKDTLNDEWFLSDIHRLEEGITTLDEILSRHRTSNPKEKFVECGRMIDKVVGPMKGKVVSLRKTISAASDTQAHQDASLSADQIGIQNDLRKSFTGAQRQLADAEGALTILRALLTESRVDKGGNGIHKKPTVEAVTSTIAKMTSMAQKKSATIDVLEAQMRKLGIANQDAQLNGSTNTNGVKSVNGHASTPLRPSLRSTAPSVYHTPQSRFGGSLGGTPSSASLRRSILGQRVNGVNEQEVDGEMKWKSGVVLSEEDRKAYKERQGAKKNQNDALREALEKRKSRMSLVVAGQ